MRIAMAVRGVLLTLAVLGGCLVTAFAVANIIDLFWPGSLLQGRNVTRVALLASGMILAATLLRPQAVRGQQILIELVAVEIVIAALIWWFSGVIAIDSLFTSWWLGINAYLTLPWLIATAIRSFRPSYKMGH
jgi:hypothetical protein